MLQNITTIRSLSNMIREMGKKKLELKRITKTASLLILSGVSSNSIPKNIIERVVDSQKKDGGWTSIVDTIWNCKFLELIDKEKYDKNILLGYDFLMSMQNKDGLWGRSQRDFSRIPVTGILFYLFPNFATKEKMILLENLWESEINSIVYKAGYSLMAYKKNKYIPQNKNQIEKTINWLIENQRENGGFAPWKNHPVDENVFCSSIAILGLLQYSEFVDIKVFKNAYDWFCETRLKNGIWKYHEIEDGASWGIYTITQLEKLLN